jgi:hypothetical protein
MEVEKPKTTKRPRPEEDEDEQPISKKSAIAISGNTVPGRVDSPFLVRDLKPPGSNNNELPVFGVSTNVVLPIPENPTMNADTTATFGSSAPTFGSSTSTPFSVSSSSSSSSTAPVFGNSFGTTTADDNAMNNLNQLNNNNANHDTSNDDDSTATLNASAPSFTPGMFGSGIDNIQPANDDNPFFQNASG